MSWQELTKIALLGTENTTFSNETLQALQALGIDVSKEAPLVLAEGAALYAQLKKAGFRLEAFTGELPKASEISGSKVCELLKTPYLCGAKLKESNLQYVPERKKRETNILELHYLYRIETSALTCPCQILCRNYHFQSKFIDYYH